LEADIPAINLYSTSGKIPLDLGTVFGFSIHASSFLKDGYQEYCCFATSQSLRAEWMEKINESITNFKALFLEKDLQELDDAYVQATVNAVSVEKVRSYVHDQLQLQCKGTEVDDVLKRFGGLRLKIMLLIVRKHLSYERSKDLLLTDQLQSLLAYLTATRLFIVLLQLV